MSTGVEEPLDRILIPDGESPIPESYSCLDGSSVYCVDTRGHKVVQASADYSLLSYKAFTIIFNFFSHSLFFGKFGRRWIYFSHQ